MTRTAFLFALLITSACDGGVTAQDPGRSDGETAGEVCTPNEVAGLPDPTSLTRVDGACLIYQRADSVGIRPRREIGKVLEISGHQVVFFEVTPETASPLQVEQLRAGATYLGVAGLAGLSAGELFEETGAPFFYHIVNLSTGALHEAIDIEPFDESLAMVFEPGSLRPVAVVAGNDLLFCDERLLEPEVR